MGVIEHALDPAPAGGHRELWLAARLVVRRGVGHLLATGADLTEILVVIADDGMTIAEVVAVVCPEAVVTMGKPFVAVLAGEDRRFVAAALDGVGTYLVSVPVGSFVIVTAPVGAMPMAAMVRVLDRMQLS